MVGASLGLVDDWPRTTDIRGTQDWTYAEITINSGSRTDLYIGARLGHWSNTTTGTAWFDDLSLREQTPNGLGSNLLQNPGFESQ
jgi:dolichyl-phosphate-mannose-protein mannosyltransferase